MFFGGCKSDMCHMILPLSQVWWPLSRARVHATGVVHYGRASGHPIGERHEVAVGCAGGVKVVGSFFEFLAQVEDLLFELADAGAECLGVVGAPDSADAEDFLAEDF